MKACITTRVTRPMHPTNNNELDTGTEVLLLSESEPISKIKEWLDELRLYPMYCRGHVEIEFVEEE